MQYIAKFHSFCEIDIVNDGDLGHFYKMLQGSQLSGTVEASVVKRIETHLVLFVCECMVIYFSKAICHVVS